MVAMKFRLQLWFAKIARVRKPRPHDALRFCFTFQDLESHDSRGPHLDRRAAALGVALREVAVAHRVERAVHRHRHVELRAARELLHVRVAAVLARRDRAQAFLRDRPLAGTAAAAVGGITLPPCEGDRLPAPPISLSCSRDGATPAVPMKEPFGMRTPGSCGEVAYSGVMSQW